MIFCALESKASNEPSAGSASIHKTLILIECNEPWASKAIQNSKIPQNVKDFLSEFLKIIGNKALLIKRDVQSEGINFYLIKTSLTEQKQFRYVLNSYEEILAINIENPDPIFLFETPLILVCTNGKKDKCCSKFGFPAYKKLDKYNEYKLEVWQCSHFGGDRFAPTVMVTPYCYYFSRVDTLDTFDFLKKINDKILHLDNLRGRCIYNPFVQAAEYHLRKIHNIFEIDELRFVSLTKINNDVQVIIFKTPTKVLDAITIKRSFANYSNFLTCSSSTPQQPYIYEIFLEN